MATENLVSTGAPVDEIVRRTGGANPPPIPQLKLFRTLEGLPTFAGQ